MKRIFLLLLGMAVLLAACAPLISDAVIVTTILLLLTRLPPSFLRFVGLAGGIFSLYLAWGLWKAWRRASPHATLSSDSDPRLGVGAALWQAVLLNSLSPGPYTFWTLVNGPLLLEALHHSVGHGLAFLAGFYTVFVTGNMLVVLLFHVVSRAILARSEDLPAIVVLVNHFIRATHVSLDLEPHTPGSGAGASGSPGANWFSDT
mgnify:CR=1 FL=1